MYEEEDFLLISGIQHFLFCRRQWALIHIEQVWKENYLTLEGQFLHEKADQPQIREKRKSTLTVRALPVHSSSLGITGVCDVVEFIENPEGVKLQGEQGTYLPNVVEYKRGKPKKDLSDTFQVVAYTLCLEEMLSCQIEKGYLYYHEIRRREELIITDALRDQVTKVLEEMHDDWKRKYTPKVKTGKFCDKCSINDLCLPKFMNVQTVSSYIKRRLSE
jgi:CRISPR-associated exonuclease Cas4